MRMIAGSFAPFSPSPCPIATPAEAPACSAEMWAKLDPSLLNNLQQ